MDAQVLRGTIAAAEALETSMHAKDGYFSLMRRKAETGWELDWEKVDEHIAFFGDELAKETIKLEEKIEIRHPETDKVCTVVDTSKKTKLGTGMPELEFMGAKTALEHGKGWELFVDAYEHGKWDPFYEQAQRQQDRELLHKQIELSTDQSKKMEGFATNLEAHVKAIQEMRSLTKRLMLLIPISLAIIIVLAAYAVLR